MTQWATNPYTPYGAQMASPHNIQVGDRFHYDDTSINPNTADIFEGEVISVMSADVFRAKITSRQAQSFYGGTEVSLSSASRYITWYASLLAPPLQTSRELPNGFDYDAHKDFMRNL